MDSEEYREVKGLIDDALKPIIADISEIKKTVTPIPILVERLTNYKSIEKSVLEHEFILRGTKEKPGITDDIEELKKQGKKTFNLIIKILAFAGTVFGLIATGKAFLF